MHVTWAMVFDHRRVMTSITLVDFAALLPMPVSPFQRSGLVCRKYVYPTKRDAQTARNAAFRRRRHRPDFLRIYACPECNGWHLTHKELWNTTLDTPNLQN
jgi:hypothetical protein